MTEAFTAGPDGSRSRKLLAPIQGAGDKSITAVRLRQPRYRDVMAFGDPSSMIIMQGAMVPNEDMAIIVKYVETLATDEAGEVILPGLLQQLDYRDAIALKDAVLDFFKAASIR